MVLIVIAFVFNKLLHMHHNASLGQCGSVYKVLRVSKEYEKHIYPLRFGYTWGYYVGKNLCEVG